MSVFDAEALRAQVARLVPPTKSVAIHYALEAGSGQGATISATVAARVGGHWELGATVTVARPPVGAASVSLQTGGTIVW